MLCCLSTNIFCLKGTVAKFSLPNVKSAFRLDLNSLPAPESTKAAYSNKSGINLSNLQLLASVIYIDFS